MIDCNIIQRLRIISALLLVQGTGAVTKLNHEELKYLILLLTVIMRHCFYLLQYV